MARGRCLDVTGLLVCLISHGPMRRLNLLSLGPELKTVSEPLPEENRSEATLLLMCGDLNFRITSGGRHSLHVYVRDRLGLGRLPVYAAQDSRFRWITVGFLWSRGRCRRVHTSFPPAQ